MPLRPRAWWSAVHPHDSEDSHLSKHRAARHRKAPERPVVDASRRAVRATLLLGGVAAVTTGVAVAGGVASEEPRIETAAATVGSAVPASAPADAVAERSEPVSRSADRRAALDPAKAAALASAAETEVRAVTRTEDAADGDPKAIASALLGEYGWSGSQFDCLDKLWTRESNWNPRADNPSSSAYGIPQALPGSKMGTVADDWETNPVTQIKWGLGYIQGRYGTPCSAWSHSERVGWY